jgi:branched-chain amino acid transport system substrate-binding protein
MGTTPLGVITVSHYSGGGDRPANKAFYAAWKKAYGENSIPSFTAVHAWDAMGGIYYAIREQKGKIDPDKTIELLRNYKTDESPRGPIAIDPRTRDIRQNEYLREVKDVNGKLVNVELEVVGKMVVDPWVEANTK